MKHNQPTLIRAEINKLLEVNGYASRALDWKLEKKRKQKWSSLSERMRRNKVFNSVKTLTELLNLNTIPDLEERIKVKYEYIQNQLKINPEAEFWDYGIYFQSIVHKKEFDNHKVNGLHPGLKVSTKGKLIWLNDQNLYTSEPHNDILKYHTVDISTIPHQGHRFVLSTFVPLPDNLKKIGREYLFCNHIDGVKYHNDITNLEWCTPSENIKHAVNMGIYNHGLGLECKNTIPLKATMAIDNLFEGITFIIAGKSKLYGVPFGRALRGQQEYAYGCKVSFASSEDLTSFPIDAPAQLVEHFKIKPQLFNHKAIALKFYNQKEVFYAIGDVEMKELGIDPTGAMRAMRREGTCKGFKVTQASKKEIHQYYIDAGILPELEGP